MIQINLQKFLLYLSQLSQTAEAKACWIVFPLLLAPKIGTPPYCRLCRACLRRSRGSLTNSLRQYRRSPSCNLNYFMSLAFKPCGTPEGDQEVSRPRVAGLCW